MKHSLYILTTALLAAACLVGCQKNEPEQGAEIPVVTPEIVTPTPIPEEDNVVIDPQEQRDDAPATVPPMPDTPQPTRKPTAAPQAIVPAAPSATAKVTPNPTKKVTPRPTKKATPKPTAKTSPKPTGTPAPTATPPESDLRAEYLIGVWKLYQIVYDGSVMKPSDFAMEMTVEFIVNGRVHAVTTTDGEPGEADYTYDVVGNIVRLFAKSGEETQMTYHEDTDEITFYLMEGSSRLELYLTRRSDAIVTPTPSPSSGSENGDIELPEIP